MGKDHDYGVTRKMLGVENSLEKGYWDDVFTEQDYFENQSAPVGSLPDERGRMKGEFDVLAVNYDEKVFLYVEVKTNPGDLYKAGEQLDRAEEHFAPEWDMIGQTWLEDQLFKSWLLFYLV